MSETFFGYCHLCEEVSEITDAQHVRGMIVWQCPVCGCYNEEEAECETYTSPSTANP